MVCARPVEGRVVRHGHRPLRPEDAVVLDDGHERLGGHGLPDPVVVPVDVDREQPEVAVEAVLAEQVVDVVAVDEGAHRTDVVAPHERARGDGADVRVAVVDDQPAPVPVHEQEPRVRLAVVLDADLDEPLGAPRDADPPDEVLDDAVVAELREDPELGLAEVGDAAHRDLLRARLPREDGEVVEPLADARVGRRRRGVPASQA